jgi:phenylacetate-CoA ligase
MGTYSNQSCSCGRGLPLMGKVTGRVADFLVKKNGDRVAGISLIENTLTKMPGIDQMQIIQNSLNEFVLNIVPGREFNQSVQSDLHHYFKTIFTGSSVSVNIIKEILPEPSGKYRFSICRIS